jgi:hypothetical protein
VAGVRVALGAPDISILGVVTLLVTVQSDDEEHSI